MVTPVLSNVYELYKGNRRFKNRIVTEVELKLSSYTISDLTSTNTTIRTNTLKVVSTDKDNEVVLEGNYFDPHLVPSRV